MAFDDLCNTGLVLQLGFQSLTESKPKQSSTVAHKIPEPSLTLSLSGETYDQINHTVKKFADSSKDKNIVQVNGELNTVKREREISTDEGEGEEDDVGRNGKKKLRLTKGQSVLLEESFKIHSTLNLKQKQELARELRLRPRQVEVWFQNRRARSKLKQTEVDCEFLKKCCDTLTDENRRLQKELHDLKYLKLAQPPVYMQLPAATLTMCPSCERIGGGVDHETMASKPLFYKRFTNSSAAC